jgi:hypothetical protein
VPEAQSRLRENSSFPDPFSLFFAGKAAAEQTSSPSQFSDEKESYVVVPLVTRHSHEQMARYATSYFDCVLPEQAFGMQHGAHRVHRHYLLMQADALP